MVFASTKKGEKKFENNDPDIEGYDEFDLNKDMEDGMPFTGKPYLGPQYEYTFTDQNTGKEVTNKQANFWIVNDDNKEVLKGRLKLKDLEDPKVFWEKSVGFDLINSIEILADPKFEGNHNTLDISFNELQEYINGLSEMTVETLAHKTEIKGNLTFWNTLKVTKTVEGVSNG